MVDGKLSLSELLESELDETSLVLPEVREASDNKQRTYQGNSKLQRVWKFRDEALQSKLKAKRKKRFDEIGVAVSEGDCVTRITFDDKVSVQTQEKAKKLIFKLQCLRKAVTPDLKR
jgi:hypothetical protein